MLKFFCVFVILFPLFSWGDFQFRYNQELFLAHTERQNTISVLNPNNRVLESPLQISFFEYRPELRFTRDKNNSRFILRGRWIFEDTKTNLLNPNEKNELQRGHSDLSDAFFEENFNDTWTWSLGLQNYQWGPAELYSPSNPIFHFSSQQKSFFFKEKGHGLFRLNATKDSGFSFVAMQEFISNNERHWIEGRDFQSKSLLKFEQQFENRANYAAFIIGSEELSRPMVGENFNWSFSNGFSLYADAKHTQGRLNYVPIRNSFNMMELVFKDSPSRDWETLGLVGVRYESASYDLRQEFLLNTAGYSKDEWDQTLSAVSDLTPFLATNLKRFSRSGLEFLKRHYSYTSLRIPDLGQKQSTNLYLRYLCNLDDLSGVFQINADHNWSDSLVLFAESMAFHGAADSEFRLVEDFQISIGLKKSF